MDVNLEREFLKQCGFVSGDDHFAPDGECIGTEDLLLRYFNWLVENKHLVPPKYNNGIDDTIEVLSDTTKEITVMAFNMEKNYISKADLLAWINSNGLPTSGCEMALFKHFKLHKL